MLLRSASTPVMKSWIQQTLHSSLEIELGNQNWVTRPVSMPQSPTSWSPTGHSSTKRMYRALSENDLGDMSKSKMKVIPNGGNDHILVEEPEQEEEKDKKGEEEMDCLETMSLRRLLSSSGLDESKVVGVNDGCSFLMGGDDDGGPCGGGRGGGGNNDNSDNHGSGDNNNNHDDMDAYYMKMIKANPENALLLGNYAKYLKEVRGDVEKAGEYCGRAILAKPNDGDLLSLYADLIWHAEKDASRAQTYFERAVRHAPDDCYVLGSYARFLWDAGEEDEEEADQEDMGEAPGNMATSSFTSPPYLVQRFPPLPPLAASS